MGKIENDYSFAQFVRQGSFLIHDDTLFVVIYRKNNNNCNACNKRFVTGTDNNMICEIKMFSASILIAKSHINLYNNKIPKLNTFLARYLLYHEYIKLKNKL